MPDQEESKLQRARKPKVRTGCVTCKIRHVKCDETKPTCKRCFTFGVKCDGYDKVPWKFVPAKILPKPASSCLEHHLSPGIRFQNEKDFQYFQMFQYKISDELSAGFDPSLWNQIVLQMSASQPILQLIIATAAIQKSKRPLDSGELKHFHHQYALRTYGSAIQGIRKLLQNPHQYSLRIALVASLLIYCVESMIGEHSRAITNIKTTIGLMSNQLMAKFRPDSERIYPDSQIEEKLLVKFRQLGRPTVTNQSQTVAAPFTPGSNVDFMSTLYNRNLYIPKKFPNVDDARSTLEQIRYLTILNYRVEKISNLFPLRVSDELKSRLADWNHSFAPLFKYSQTEAGIGSFVSAMTLAIQAYTVDLIFCGPRQPSVTVFSLQDTIIGIFAFATGYQSSVAPSRIHSQALSNMQSVLNLCHSLIDHPRFFKSFVCDVGIIPCVWSILLMSPDREMRLDALQILHKMKPRVEGAYNSTYIAEAGEHAIKLLDSRERCQENSLNKVESFYVPCGRLSVSIHFN